MSGNDINFACEVRNPQTLIPLVTTICILNACQQQHAEKIPHENVDNAWPMPMVYTRGGHKVIKIERKRIKFINCKAYPTVLVDF